MSKTVYFHSNPPKIQAKHTPFRGKSVNLQAKWVKVYTFRTKMKFSLSNDSRQLIQQSTGLDCVSQCSTSIYSPKADVRTNKDYRIRESRDVAPRGSIYLQMNRVLSLRKVKSYLKRI